LPPDRRSRNGRQGHPGVSPRNPTERFMAGGFADAVDHRRPVAWACAVLIVALVPAASRSEDVDFNRDVLPILSANCFQCHGPDAGKRKADLRLDVRSVAVEQQAVVPGKSDQSGLIARVTADDADGRMPPPKHGPRLKPEQVQVLRAWVERGGAYSEHWAFVPPKRPPVPAIRKPQSTIRNPIDAFV